MRLYTFTNYYLSSIQVGIQTAHVVAELFNTYPNNADDLFSPYHTVSEWAKNHKTIVCLNGGNNAMIEEVWSTLRRMNNTLSYPIAFFKEDAQSLGGIMTCVGVIVPSEVYEYAQIYRQAKSKQEADMIWGRNDMELATPEIEFATFLNQFALAK